MATTSHSNPLISTTALLCTLTFMFSSVYQFWMWYNWQGIVLWCGLAALLNYCANYGDEEEDGAGNESN